MSHSSSYPRSPFACLVGPLLPLCLLTGCAGGDASSFVCAADSECVRNGEFGVCQPEGACSFPDPNCVSGLSYPSGQCVPQTEGSSGATSEDSDAGSGSPSGDDSAGPSTSGPTTTSPPLPTAGDDGSSGGDAAPQVEVSWARSFGAPVDPSFVDTDAEQVGDVAVDAAGNLYAAGQFQGVVDFDGQVITSAGGDDAWVASFNPDGTMRWVRTYGGPGHDATSGVTIDAAGAVVVVGGANGDPGVGGGTWADSSHLQAYVARFNATTGATQDVAVFPATGGNSRFMKVAAGSAGDLYAVGGFYEAIDLDTTRTSAGDEDAFAVRLNSTLGIVSSWTAGDTGKDLARGVAVAPDGRVAISSYFSDSLTVPTFDLAVELLDSTLGTSVWTRREPTADTSSSKLHRVVFVGNDLVTAGFMRAAVDFGQPQGFAGGEDAIVARLSGADGSTVWAHSWGGAARDIVAGLAVDANGNLVVAGTYSDGGDFFGHPLDAFGANDAFVAGMTPDGDVLWARTYGGTAADLLDGVAVHGAGTIYLGGMFRNSMTIGGTTLTAAEALDALLIRVDVF